jgi:hypothetical protein
MGIPGGPVSAEGTSSVEQVGLSGKDRINHVPALSVPSRHHSVGCQRVVRSQRL